MVVLSSCCLRKTTPIAIDVAWWLGSGQDDFTQLIEHLTPYSGQARRDVQSNQPHTHNTYIHTW